MGVFGLPEYCSFSFKTLKISLGFVNLICLQIQKYLADRDKTFESRK
jgi:hypothetical protein